MVTSGLSRLNARLKLFVLFDFFHTSDLAVFTANKVENGRGVVFFSKYLRMIKKYQQNPQNRLPFPL